jgi:O-antigen/teichoic acid export membrane protein
MASIRLKKSFNITILTVLIPLILQLLYIKYVSFFVNKNDFGDFVILSTFVMALSQLFLSVPSQSFMRFYNGSIKINFINEFRTYLIGLNILSVVLVYLLYVFYGDRFDTTVYILIYLYFAISNNYGLNQQIFLLNTDRKKYLLLKILEAMAKFVFPIFWYSIYYTLESFLIGLVVGYSLSFMIILLLLKEYPFKIELNLNNQKKYLLYAYPIIFSAIFNWSISFSDRYFIDYYVDTRSVAIYAILAMLAGFAQVLGMIYATYVNPIILSVYEKNNEEGLSLLKNYVFNFLIFNIFALIIFLTLPRSLFTIFVESSIIYNNMYYSTFLILVLGIFLTVFQTAMSMYFILIKRLDVHAKIFIIASIVNFILNFYVIEYGIIAVAISTLIAYVIINILIVLWISKNCRHVKTL